MKENDQELIAAAIRSLFNLDIREARLPERFKFLAMKSYKGKSDPQDYLDHFNDFIELHSVSKMANCRVFSITLTCGAKKWLRAVPAGSISGWQQLSTLFLQHFQATRRFVVSLAHLGNVK